MGIVVSRKFFDIFLDIFFEILEMKEGSVRIWGLYLRLLVSIW